MDTATPMYLIDSDTGRVTQGPVGHGDETWPGQWDDQIAAHSATFPHRRFHIGPHPGDVDDYRWTVDLAARYGLPDITLWAQVTPRERPADELLRPLEDRCTGATFCGATQLVLVTWRGRDDFVQGVGPHRWWRRVSCTEHLDAVLRPLVDRCLHDPSPDSPRGIGVLIPVGAEWGVRWAHGRVSPQASEAVARRLRGLAGDPAVRVVRRDDADSPWTEAS